MAPGPATIRRSWCSGRLFSGATARGKTTMTKAEIVDRICDKNKLSHTDGINIVEATFEIIEGSLGRGENVKIMRFGNLWCVLKIRVKAAIREPVKNSSSPKERFYISRPALP